MLLREHEPSKVNEKDKIEVGRIANVLATDWGFYYTVKSNLGKVARTLDKYETLSNSDREVVADRIQTILDAIEETPKSTKWKLRAKIGTKKKWYNDVGEVKRWA